MTLGIECICQREILDILIGDKKVYDMDGNELSMKYLRGSDIFALFDVMGLETDLQNGYSRWVVMDDFIKASIKANCINASLTYLFKNIDPSKVSYRNVDPKETMNHIIETILNEINLYLIKCDVTIKLVQGKIVVNEGSSPIIDSQLIEKKLTWITFVN